MSQYAYIPSNRIPEVTLQYGIATPTSWQFEKDSQQYGGMEEVLFSTQQKAEIESLGGQWFESAEAFQKWLNDSNDSAFTVMRDRQFGQLILNEYLAQNRALALSLSDNIAQLTKFGSAKQLLETGAITSVLAIVQGIATDAIFTQERKNYFINKINDYLA